MFYPRAVWDRVWALVPKEVAAAAIRSFHAETIQEVLAMPAGKAREAAESEILLSEHGTATYGDSIESYLGLREGQRQVSATRPAEAAMFALKARRAFYASESNEDKWSSVPVPDLAPFYRECAKTTADDLIQHLQRACDEAGLVVQLVE